MNLAPKKSKIGSVTAENDHFGVHRLMSLTTLNEYENHRMRVLALCAVLCGRSQYRSGIPV